MAALPTAADVLAWAGLPVDDVRLASQATQHIRTIAAAVYAYTRGVGFSIPGSNTAETLDMTPGIADVAPSVRAVVMSAASRSLVNPTQSRRLEAGSYSELPGSAASFSLIETQMLNGLRRRAG